MNGFFISKLHTTSFPLRNKNPFKIKNIRSYVSSNRTFYTNKTHKKRCEVCGLNNLLWSLHCISCNSKLEDEYIKEVGSYDPLVEIIMNTPLSRKNPIFESNSSIHEISINKEDNNNNNNNKEIEFPNKNKSINQFTKYSSFGTDFNLIEPIISVFNYLLIPSPWPSALGHLKLIWRSSRLRDCCDLKRKQIHDFESSIGIDSLRLELARSILQRCNNDIELRRRLLFVGDNNVNDLRESKEIDGENSMSRSEITRAKEIVLGLVGDSLIGFRYPNEFNIVCLHIICPPFKSLNIFKDHWVPYNDVRSSIEEKGNYPSVKRFGIPAEIRDIHNKYK